VFRIDNSSAVPSLPIAGPPGTPGFFTDGNPAAALEATIVDGWWLNMLQEEILTVVTQAGITPSKTSYRQLYDAIIAIASGSVDVSGFLPLIGGTLANPGNLTINGGDFRQISTADTSWYAMGLSAAMVVAGEGNRNIIAGYLYGNSPPNTLTFPTAVAGFAKLAAGSTGNCVFGTYGLAEIHASAGVAVACELTVRNFAGAPDTNMPPNLTHGTTTIVPVGLQVTSAGPYDSSLGILVGKEGGAGTVFHTAHYIQDFAAFGIVIGAQPSGNQINIDSVGNGNNINLRLRTTGAMQPSNAVIDVEDAAYVSQFSVRQNGNVYAPQYRAVGAAAAFIFAERQAGGMDWYWYAENGQAALAGGIGPPKLTINQYGELQSNQFSALGNGAAFNFEERQQPGAATTWHWFAQNGQAALSRGTDPPVFSLDNNGNLYGDKAWLGALNVTYTAEIGGNFLVNGTNAWRPGGGPWDDSASDIRVKKAETVQPYTRGLAEICGLRPVTYEFNGLANTLDDGTIYHGLIAQEVTEVMPEMVQERELRLHPEDAELSRVLSLKTGPITYALINAIKELAGRVEALEARR